MVETLIKDIIVIALAIAGLTGVSLYSMYKFMTKVVEDNLKSFVEELNNNTMAAIKARIYGYGCWMDYKRGNNIQDLNEAITKTLEAYENHAQKLDEKKSSNEELICWIKNNLAYYLAERHRVNPAAALPGDGDPARKFAEYPYERIDKYPKNAEKFVDTYRFVQKQFP